MRRLLGVLLAAAVTLSASPAAAGPWAPDQNHGYVKIWLKYLYGFDFHAGDGNTYGYGAYHEVFLSAYAELGLVDDLALVLHTEMVRTFHLEDPRDGSYQSHVTPGDPLLGLRWQFLQEGRFVMALEGGVRAPFARAQEVQTVYGTAEGNPAVGALRIGAGAWDFPLSLGAGYAADRWYMAGSAGYVLRTEGYDHVLTWTAEVGATLIAEFGVRGRVTGYHSLDVWLGDEAPGHESPSGIGNGTTYIGFAVEGDYQIAPRWYVGLTVEGGLFLLSRQTGGPVVSVYLAHAF
ncbi:MAG: hypothetical protein RLO52_36680 [Sandaracinaceae bacterium]